MLYSNKDENFHRFALSAIRGKLLEREREEREKERERNRQREREREKEVERERESVTKKV